MAPQTPQDNTDRLSFILTLAVLTALSATTVDICLPAQPEIAQSFGERPEAGGVLVSAYFLGYGPGQLLWGPLSDRYGRMKPLFIGLAGFFLITLLHPLATSLEMLAGLRVVQGAFGGSGPVIARAIARDQGGGQRTARLLATISIVFGAAPLIAPLIGSGILLVAEWEAQFWGLAAFSLVLMGAAHVFLGPSSRPLTADRVPIAQTFRSALGLFGERDFVVGCGAVSSLVLGYSTLLGTGAAMTEARYGIPAASFGPLFAIAAVAAIVGPWISRRILRTRAPDTALKAGALVAVVASLALLLMSWVHVPLAVLWLFVFTYVLSFGMIAPMANALALEPAGESAGIASSFLGAVSTMAGAAGAGLAASALFDSAYQAICLTMAGGGLCCAAFVALGLRKRTPHGA